MSNKAKLALIGIEVVAGLALLTLSNRPAQAGHTPCSEFVTPATYHPLAQNLANLDNFYSEPSFNAPAQAKNCLHTGVTNAPRSAFGVLSVDVAPYKFGPIDTTLRAYVAMGPDNPVGYWDNITIQFTGSRMRDFTTDAIIPGTDGIVTFTQFTSFFGRNDAGHSKVRSQPITVDGTRFQVGTNFPCIMFILAGDYNGGRVGDNVTAEMCWRVDVAPMPIITTTCTANQPTATISWSSSTGFTPSSFRVEFDNDDFAGGWLSKNVASNVFSTNAPSGFTGVGASPPAIPLAPSATYQVRVNFVGASFGNQDLYTYPGSFVTRGDCGGPPPVQGVQGKVFIDGNGSGSYEAGEPIIQNPAGACGGYVNVAGVTVSSGPSGNLNVCTPDPGFKIDTGVGSQTVSVNLPVGWVSTNGSTRVVNVATGVYYNVPWFGIRPTLAVPAPNCSGINKVASVTINPAGLSVGNYVIDISLDSAFTPANTSNRSFPVGTTTVTDVPNGFSAGPAAVLVGGTTYYVRVFYNGPNVHSETQSFVASLCAPAVQGVQGKVFIDQNGNGSYEAGEPIVQNPPGACGGYVAVGVTVSAGASSNLNDCTPDPGYKIDTPAGNQTVTVNLPAGWMVTNGATRSVNVTSGAYFQVFPWFGIRPTLAIPIPSCSGVTSIASVTINPAGLSVANYYIDISTGSGFAPASTSNRLFPAGTTTVPNVPIGFSASSSVPLVANTTYYVRVYYNGPNVHSQTQSFVASNCSNQGVQGKVFIDQNGNGSYEAGEPIVQSPTGACGGYINVNATVSAAASTVSLNACTPDPGYRIVTTSGSQTVTVNLPAGWVATSGVTRTVNVAMGSFYNVPWFGVLPTLAAPIPNCFGAVSTASVTINPAGLSVSNYFIDISTGNGFAPASTSNRSFPVGTGTVSDVPIGFSASSSIPLVPGTTYYVRVYYAGPNVHSQTQSFVASTCGYYDNVITSMSANNMTPLAGSTVRISLTVYNVGNGSSPNMTVTTDGGHYNTPGGVPASTTFMGSAGGTYIPPPPAPATYQWTGPGLPPNSGAPFNGAVDWQIDASVGPNVTICFVATVTPGRGSGAVVNEPVHDNSVCVVTAAVQTPYFITSYSDLHAGGAPGATCSLGGAGIVRGTPGSKVDYIISAGSSIDNSVAGLKFGNTPSDGLYGKACRPDLVDLAERYRGAYTSAPQFVTYNTANPIPQLVGVVGVSTMVYWAGPGPITIPSNFGVLGKVTLYVNGDVHIGGNITYSSAPTTLANLPGFGIIASGDILINKDVTNLDGYYYSKNGKIDTCDGITVANIPANCNKPLRLNGMAMANSFRLARTGPSLALGSQQAEEFNYLGDLFIAPPPVFEDAFSFRAVKPRYDGELPPLY